MYHNEIFKKIFIKTAFTAFGAIALFIFGFSRAQASDLELEEIELPEVTIENVITPAAPTLGAPPRPPQQSPPVILLNGSHQAAPAPVVESPKETFVQYHKRPKMMAPREVAEEPLKPKKKLRAPVVDSEYEEPSEEPALPPKRFKPSVAGGTDVQPNPSRQKGMAIDPVRLKAQIERWEELQKAQNASGAPTPVVANKPADKPLGTTCDNKPEQSSSLTSQTDEIIKALEQASCSGCGKLNMLKEKLSGLNSSDVAAEIETRKIIEEAVKAMREMQKGKDQKLSSLQVREAVAFMRAAEAKGQHRYFIQQSGDVLVMNKEMVLEEIKASRSSTASEPSQFPNFAGGFSAALSGK